MYDLETKNLFQRRTTSTAFTDDDFKNMGIASGALYDFQTEDFSVYMAEDIHQLAIRLNNASLVVGFNILKFDNPLLTACGFPLREDLAFYDIYTESKNALGLDVDDHSPGGMNLDAHLLSTLGKKHTKTGKGALAPILYQEKQYSKLLNYNLGDVRRTKDLFLHVWENGWVSTLGCGKQWMRNPQEAMTRNNVDLQFT